MTEETVDKTYPEKDNFDILLSVTLLHGYFSQCNNKAIEQYNN